MYFDTRAFVVYVKFIRIYYYYNVRYVSHSSIMLQHAVASEITIALGLIRTVLLAVNNRLVRAYIMSERI